ncbi:DEKNAAC105667 [Brettanomyces naardenensis]|uniref:DEKNAAC105667 n=1 Tax=Brettanomyces naardenensis TaxID=13370 RepID=A0A448YU47_BRENA|nr:DEKNAAC105667 [Brettanomyces naardenensis]
MRGGNRGYRPENILRRAEDFIAVEQKEDALQTLYGFLTSRRIRGVEPAEMEPIAKLFVELGTELRSGKIVKDGLHQYKKAVQVTDAGLESLQTVCKYFLELAEAQLSKAEGQAGAAAEKAVEKSVAAAAAAQKVLDAYDEVDVEATEEDDDDEDVQFSISPEDILLSAVSTDDTKDRSNRQLVVPWLRFLWESYRTVLDILRNNSKLEVGYCYVCDHAFDFCAKYERRTEFRRLCEMLRAHLQTVSQKPNDRYQVTNPVDLSNPDTLQRYLESRFAQLNAAVKLELWQEAFRSVEDVHTLMTLSKRQPKPAMMMSYYDNLAQIFAVSGDSLFHAAARQKYFSLLLQSPIATEEQKRHYASLQLISALAVSETASGADDFGGRKVHRLASLLSMGNPPTRESLLEQAVGPQTLRYTDDLLKQLNSILEEEFHPLSFARDSQKVFAGIDSNKEYRTYIPSLLDVVVGKIFREVSQVYQTIKIDFLVRLCTFEGPFKLSNLEIESRLLEAADKNVVNVKIDQDARVVTFRSNAFGEPVENSILSTLAEKASAAVQLTPAEFVRFQLSNLAKALSESVKLIDVKETKSVDRELKERALEQANAEFDNEKEEILRRFDVLQERKTKLAELKRLAEERAAKEKLEKQVASKKAEQERAEQEAARRREDKIKREIEAAKEKQKKEMIEEVNSKGIIEIDEQEAADLDVDKLRMMQLEKLEKDQKVTEAKMEVLARRNDYLERAERKFQLTLLEKDSQQQIAKEEEEYNALREKRIEQARKEHDHDIKERDRLKRMVIDYKRYAALANSEQQHAFEKSKAEADKKLEEAKQQRIREYISQKKAEFEEEQQLKKEEQQRQKKLNEEEHRRAAAEEERRQQAEESRLNRDPERRLYTELLAKEKAGGLSKFSEKMMLKKLKRRYEN